MQILNTQKVPKLSVVSFFSLKELEGWGALSLWMWDVRWRQRTEAVSDRGRIKLS